MRQAQLHPDSCWQSNAIQGIKVTVAMIGGSSPAVSFWCIQDVCMQQIRRWVLPSQLQQDQPRLHLLLPGKFRRPWPPALLCNHQIYWSWACKFSVMPSMFILLTTSICCIQGLVMSVQPEGGVYRVGDNQEILQRQYVAKVVMSPIPALSSSKAALTICSNAKRPIIWILLS